MSFELFITLFFFLCVKFNVFQTIFGHKDLNGVWGENTPTAVKMKIVVLAMWVDARNARAFSSAAMVGRHPLVECIRLPTC